MIMSYNEGEDYDEYDDLDDYDELEGKVSFDLVEIQDETTDAHGSLKSWETKDGGLVHYSDDPTGFTISVERLLQADGYADNKKSQRLTLLVLKLVLACNDDSRIAQVVFNMNFEEMPEKIGSKRGKTGNDVKPDIVAWAPFDKMIKTNETELQQENKSKVDGEINSGAAGANAKVSAGWESTISWAQTYFESGHAYPTMGKDQTRTGVRWVLKANPKQAAGVPPNITVGILLSRQSDGPYLANFNIRIKGGIWHDLCKGIERMFGRKPDETRPYKVAPSKEPIVRYTGSKMLSKVNLNNMVALQGKGDDLNLVWSEEEGTENDEEGL